jgi:hypothetical protein
MQFKLSNVRLSYPKLFKPEEFQGDGNPMYSCSFLLPKDHPQLPAIRKAIDEVGQAKFEKTWPTVKKGIEAKDASCLHDGNAKDSAGYEDHFYIACRAKPSQRPTVVNRDRTPLTEADGVIYGGCYVNAVIEIWAQGNEYGKRINAQVTGVQFLKDGDSFGGGAGPASADEFDDLGQGADAEEIA